MTGKELRAMRERAGWTRTQLGAAIGRTERTIYRMEDGDTPILQANEIAIEAVLSGKVGAKSPRTSTPKSKTA